MALARDAGWVRSKPWHDWHQALWVVPVGVVTACGMIVDANERATSSQPEGACERCTEASSAGNWVRYFRGETARVWHILDSGDARVSSSRCGLQFEGDVEERLLHPTIPVPMPMCAVCTRAPKPWSSR